MQLTFLFKDTGSNGGQSPSFYQTDRGSYVVQGWKVVDPEALATLNLPDHETAVEVPANLVAQIADRGV
jgi:hypothetical protein